MKSHSWLVVVFLLTLIGYSNAQNMPASFDETHQKALANNPPDVKFTLRLKDDKTRFHQGEIIRLELSFSSTRPQTYSIDAATYDRSGRMESESFFLDPADGAIDPLREYFAEARFGGGLRSIPALTEKPHTLTLDLNEWRRFDKPGDYRLYVVSNRVTDESGARKIRLVASNLVTFTILPADPAWSERALQDALQILDAKPVADQTARASAPSPDARREASRLLRFLDTPEAAREMARRYGDRENPGDFDLMLGIVASSHDAIAMEELHRRMADPNEPISENFMYLVTRLAFQLRRPESLPPYPDPKDTQKVAAWQERARARGLKQDAVTKEEWDMLATAFKNKRGQARTVTLYTLANRDWRTTGGDDFSSPAAYAAELRAAFAELSPESQRVLLEYRWPAIKSPEMLPHLRRLLAGDGTDYQEKSLRDLAARRLWEMRPQEARTIFLKEITSPLPRLSPEVLALLPDTTLPQADEALAKHLENRQSERTDFEAVVELIERYATPTIAPRVKKVLMSHLGTWACAPQEAMIAYFLRVEPDFAKNAIQKVLASQETGCRHSLFSKVGRRQWRPQLEELALAQMNNPDVEVAIDAVGALGKYGSPGSESALWKRLEAWHAAWKDRADDLEYRHARPNPHQEQARLEYALFEALTKSPAWISDVAKLQKLKTLVVSQNTRLQVGSLIGQWNGRFSVSRLPFEPEEYTVAHYRLKSKAELKQKLAQFPKGTVFVWMPGGGDKKGELSMEEELRNFLTPRGMSLEKPQPMKN